MQMRFLVETCIAAQSIYIYILYTIVYTIYYRLYIAYIYCCCLVLGVGP